MKLHESGEEVSQLTHLSHSEQLVMWGPKSLKTMYNALNSTYKALKSNTNPEDIDVKLKIDGSPSSIAATNFNGEKFVATKGFFNKDRKSAHTPEECDQLWGAIPDLCNKMKGLLAHLDEINIPEGEIWQGDFLFSKEDLSSQNIDGTSYVTFQPNTIIYAVPDSDPIAKLITQADLGIAWHTTYKGPDFDNLKIGFNASVNRLGHPISVFMMDAVLPSLAGIGTLTSDETEKAEATLASLKSNIEFLLSDTSYNTIVSHSAIIELVEKFDNSRIRSEVGLSDPKGFVEEFKAFVMAEAEKKAAALKKEASKVAKIEKGREICDFIETNRGTFEKIYEVKNQVVELKEFFIKKLNKLGSFKTFVRHIDKGFLPCGQEGYAVSDIDGNIQKFVSRIEFSHNNFSKEIVKGWMSDKRLQEGIEEDILEGPNAELFKSMKNDILADVDVKDSNPARDFAKNPADPKKQTILSVIPKGDVTREVWGEELKNKIDSGEISDATVSKFNPKPIIDLVYHFDDDFYKIHLMGKPSAAAGNRSDTADTQESAITLGVALATGNLNPSIKDSYDKFYSKLDSSWKNTVSAEVDYIASHFCKKDVYMTSGGGTGGQAVTSSDGIDFLSIIESKFKEVRPKEGFTLKKYNSWDDSDMFVCRKDFFSAFKSSMEKCTTLTEMLDFLYKCKTERDAFGVSLKKMGKKIPQALNLGYYPARPSVEDEATKMAEGMTFSRIKISPMTLPFKPEEYQIFMSDNNPSDDANKSFHFRFKSTKTTSKESIKVESLHAGDGAAEGSVGPDVIFNLFRDLSGVSFEELPTSAGKAEASVLSSEELDAVAGRIKVIESSSKIHKLAPSITSANWALFRGYIESLSTDLRRSMGRYLFAVNCTYMLAVLESKKKLEIAMCAARILCKKDTAIHAPRYKVY